MLLLEVMLTVPCTPLEFVLQSIALVVIAVQMFPSCDPLKSNLDGILPYANEES